MTLPLDHVAIAVPSLSAALPLYEALSGSKGSPRERVPAQGVDVVFLGDAGARVELIAPIAADSAVARFLEKRGPGLHHLAYRVPDLPAALANLEAAGFELIDRAPRSGAHNRQIAFIHPRSTGGVLVELVEETP